MEALVISGLYKVSHCAQIHQETKVWKWKVPEGNQTFSQILLRPSQQLTHLFLFFIALLGKTSEAKLIFKIPENVLKPLEHWKKKLWAIKEPCFSVFPLDSFICIFPSTFRERDLRVSSFLFSFFFLALLHFFSSQYVQFFTRYIA